MERVISYCMDILNQKDGFGAGSFLKNNTILDY